MEYYGINQSILSHASLLAMILGLFSLLLGTGIQVYIGNNLHCAPTGAVCSNQGTETARNIAKALECLYFISKSIVRHRQSDRRYKFQY